GLVSLDYDGVVPAEGYRLAIGKKGIKVSSSTPAGAFYAFQTLKQLLPANVSAGTRAESEIYTLPLGEIVDEPRYEYRGFMLDVSRHFFDVQEIKKMLDLMAVYKLNRFHWHLTDDQGWRLPVAKYPELTGKGATNKNILLSDFTAQRQWRAGEDVVYGPYAYTADDIRDIVEYAGERHIEVIPEVDMPGHMVAAINAYPEFSTDPRSEKIAVHEDFSHEIWNKGGVSRDVLDVSNPKAIQFAKDVVDVLAEFFPYEYIHIGGDECPTLAWEHSDSCKAMMERLGMKDARALQSWFTKEIADYARERHGRKVMGWNELVSEGNVDMDMIKAIDPVIFCWIGGEKESQEAGLKFVYTPFNGGYYINRSYKGHDTIGAMKDGALRTTIEVLPPDYSNCIGVQGTFWTEQVDRYEDMEYLALPRLLGIAEQGWSHEREKDYGDFLRRVIKETEYLRLAGFNYGAHQLEKKD
ncbi:MAG: beta-N-acetylhexosaminidase, partial [Muribaculaceae bacterium]|nr:beta-N-acetylhexosaminidase [Muribaculaceae bacterium]